MKCPKCGYTSFPHLESCGQCGKGLAEQRLIYGIYALRPDPPDLMLAYQDMKVDMTRAPVLQTPSMPPAIDLAQLDEIAIELPEAEPATPGAQERKAPDAAADRLTTPDVEPAAAAELPPEGVSDERANTQAGVMPPTLDLSELGDITLDLDDASDREGTSPEQIRTPPESPMVKQVYDLDLDEDLDGPTLAEVEESGATDAADEESADYTLEIEDEITLEIDELAIEEDDEAEEDDDDR